jgi:hypothetical protein
MILVAEMNFKSIKLISVDNVTERYDGHVIDKAGMNVRI